MDENQNRKIILPDYCCPFGGWSKGGDENCDHDYPPESRKEHDPFKGPSYVCWTCSKCGMKRCYEVYQ